MCTPALFALLGIGVQQIAKDKSAQAQLETLGGEQARQIGFRDAARKNILGLAQGSGEQQVGNAAIASDLGNNLNQAADRGIQLFSGSAAPGSAGAVTAAVQPSLRSDIALNARVAAPGIAAGRRRMTIADMGADNGLIEGQANASARMLPLRMDLASSKYADLDQAGQLLSLGGAGWQQSRMWSRPSPRPAGGGAGGVGGPYGDFGGGATYVDPYSGLETAYT